MRGIGIWYIPLLLLQEKKKRGGRGGRGTFREEGSGGGNGEGDYSGKIADIY